jgi:hypothetical protein
MTTDERRVRAETPREQHDTRFGHRDAAITPLTWTVDLWGAVMTSLVAAVVVRGKR